MSKEEMMNDLIKTRGFEDEMTIYFCEMCEKPNMDNRELCVLYRLIINYPIYDENETEEEFQERMDKFFLKIGVDKRSAPWYNKYIVKEM